MMPRQDRLSKLVGVFDEFHNQLASVRDELAVQLNENWRGVRPRYVDPSPGISRSALAGGLEQGLREMPWVLKRLTPEARAKAAKALAYGIQSHCPDFEAKERARLDKVKARGFIRGENEFYLVRYHMDVLEGDEARKSELEGWYAVIERFEAKSRRG